MTASYILLQNLRRNPLRTLLTAAAFALPMAIFVAAISMVIALIEIGRANEKELRLAVHQKVTLINLIPDGHRRRIEALDAEHNRLVAVCGMRWFGGKIPNTQTVIQSLAADADTFPIVYADAEMTESDTAAWNRDRQACVIGTGLSETHGWREGSRLVLKSTVPPYLELEFHVVKIMSTPSRTNVLYFRRDYLAESLRAANSMSADSCNIFWVKCRSEADLHALQPAVDREFANSPDETKSEDENAFAAGFVQASGNLPGLMQAMAIVVVAIIALIGSNTMMMSFRERIRELAVFKAIGFGNRRVFMIVLAESVLLAMFGAVCGTLIGISSIPVLVRYIKSQGFLPISALHVSPIAIGTSLTIALLLGVASGLWPAVQALRLRTVDALRRAG